MTEPRCDGQRPKTAAAAYPMPTETKEGFKSKIEMWLILLAHPTRFECVTFASGGHGTISGFQVSSNDQ